MQSVVLSSQEAFVPMPARSTVSATATSAYTAYQIIRRNGAVVSFEPSKIAVALMKAFLAVHGTQGAASASVRETVDGLTEAVVRALHAAGEGAAALIGTVTPGPAEIRLGP
jgi:ribonucleoside-diphosphate reductase alpha chain